MSMNIDGVPQVEVRYIVQLDPNAAPLTLEREYTARSDRFFLTSLTNFFHPPVIVTAPIAHGARIHGPDRSTCFDQFVWRP